MHFMGKSLSLNIFHKLVIPQAHAKHYRIFVVVQYVQYLIAYTCACVYSLKHIQVSTDTFFFFWQSAQRSHAVFLTRLSMTDLNKGKNNIVHTVIALW